MVNVALGPVRLTSIVALKDVKLLARVNTVELKNVVDDLNVELTDVIAVLKERMELVVVIFCALRDEERLHIAVPKFSVFKLI